MPQRYPWLMTTKDKEMLDSVIYSYSSQANQLEEENRILKETIQKLREEVEAFKKTPLMVCEVTDVLDEGAIIRIPNGNQFSVNVASGCAKLNPGDNVLAEQKNLTVINKLELSGKFNVERYVIIEKPTISWNLIGGLKDQVREVQEVVELPLKSPELFKKIGIEPPKGLLLYGPPGTGKTLLAKAVAASTNSTFIEVVGSELVQKFIGEGAKLVKEIFELARKRAPSIIFIDEIDALAAKRVEVGTSGEREVNRTFMQLLAEVDGFKPLDNVKIIGATNRKDILDPAIVRPGRLDRIIHVGIPDNEARKQIFAIHTRKISMANDVRIERLIKLMEQFSGAEIRAVCTEAGYFAIRAKRSQVKQKDFLDAIEKVKRDEELEASEYMHMFG
ncbi:TPA: proteasome-activating nucleotidase [Candidatus Woesearchaeota archaeon]|nr:proteasome-activating nucleotidase [Candidatus Woesearchaeota archaeon]